MSHRHDVVVVGGRVAGSATALHLARAGHDVLVIDRAGPPADTTSTHALMRTGVLQLQRAGLLERIVEAGTPPIEQVTLVFEDERITFPVADKCGVDTYYAPRRTVLDTVLLESARDAGARFVTGVTVADVTRDESGRVDGVVARRDGREDAIGSRYVVGADGVRSRVARSVGSRVLRRHPPGNSVVYGYFEGVDVAGYEFRFVGRRNVGYVPTNEGLTLVFVGGPLSEAVTDGEEYLRDTLRDVAPDMAATVAQANRVGRLHRANGVPNLLRDPAGPGWALVGDAGFTEDPIAAHGISDALRDAELVAVAIDAALVDPATGTEALGEYRRARDRFASALLDHTVPLSRFGWDGPEASRLLRRIGDITDDECRFLSSRRPMATPLAS